MCLCCDAAEHFADRQTNEEITRLLAATKILLTGENEIEPSADIIAQVANEVYAQDLLSLMVIHMSKFEFEVSRRWRKSEEMLIVGSERHLQHLQHTASPTDWDEIAYRGIHLEPARHHL